MANDLNLCQFIGRLGQDPDQKYLSSGDAVVNFSLAVGWKGKDKEGTEWVNVVAFKKLAEIIGQYCTKGQQIYVAGKMRTRKWQDRDGQDRYTVEIVAEQMQMFGGRGEAGGSRESGSQGQQRSDRGNSAPQQSAQMGYSRRATAQILNINLPYFRRLCDRFGLHQHFKQQRDLRQECKGHGKGWPKGKPQARRARYTDAEILAEVGKYPVSTLFQSMASMDIATVHRRFGSWTAARSLAHGD